MRTTATKWPTLFYEDTRPEGSLSRERAIDAPIRGEVTWIGGNPYYWTAFTQMYHVMVLGPKVFWKRGPKVTLTYKDGRFYGNLGSFVVTIVKAFNLDWIATNKWTYRVLAERKDLWKSVITGKITNPESLAKAYSRKYFKGAFSYRNIKDYFAYGCGIALSDFYYYTTNPDYALEKFMTKEEVGFPAIITDILQYCKRFNEKVNPLWSMKRLHDYHQDQIRRKELQRIEAIDCKPIASEFHAEGLELILDERTCYLEGLMQHNCVHSCYWRRVAKGDYLLASGVVNKERITLGIEVSIIDGVIATRMDQVHTIYNGRVSLDTDWFCRNWIDTYDNELEEVVKQIRKNAILPPPPQEIEIPF